LLGGRQPATPAVDRAAGQTDYRAGRHNIVTDFRLRYSMLRGRCCAEKVRHSPGLHRAICCSGKDESIEGVHHSYASSQPVDSDDQKGGEPQDRNQRHSGFCSSEIQPVQTDR
jgi:hypothetical protein